MNDLVNYLKNDTHRVFIETGSLHGDGIQLAIRSGYKQIVSIELSPKYYQISFDRFLYNPHVKVIHGDSTYVLPKVLEHIDEEVIFWLDGHYSGGDTGLGEVNSPLMFELDAIKNHHIKTHTILIDDLRCWTNPVGEFDKWKEESNKFNTEIIIQKIKEINSEYKFELIDNNAPNDVLVAHM